MILNFLYAEVSEEDMNTSPVINEVCKDDQSKGMTGEMLSLSA